MRDIGKLSEKKNMNINNNEFIIQSINLILYRLISKFSLSIYRIVILLYKLSILLFIIFDYF